MRREVKHQRFKVGDRLDPPFAASEDEGRGHDSRNEGGVKKVKMTLCRGNKNLDVITARKISQQPE